MRATLKYLAQTKKDCRNMSRDDLIDIIALFTERLDEIVEGLQADEKRLTELTTRKHDRRPETDGRST